VATVRRAVAEFGARFPGDCGVDGRYRDRESEGAAAGANVGWTTGFRTGLIWLANDLRPGRALEHAGLQDVASFADRLERRVDVENHDLGMVYMTSCVAASRLAEANGGADVALRAADVLMERFIEAAGVFQAWGPLNSQVGRARAIIDSTLCMPLLHWASRQTGDPRYSAAASRHLRQINGRLVRSDGSTFHTFFWDRWTGAPLGGATGQGHSDDSCWARGQAWGIYGFALNHRWCADPALLDAAQACAEYYLSRLPSDSVPCWDLVFQDEGDAQPRDSSAAAIAVCGLLELSELAPEQSDRRRYRDAGLAALTTLIEGYLPDQAGRPNAHLLHGVYSMPEGLGVDEPSLWGDYFYVEALTRLVRPEWTPHWLTGLEVSA
jgi:unsaturated chondroitin disaccharide hydrolase